MVEQKYILVTRKGVYFSERTRTGFLMSDSKKEALVFDSLDQVKLFQHYLKEEFSLETLYEKI